MFIVKVPGVNENIGCERAGNAVLKELENIEINEQGKLIDKNLLDLEEIHIDNKNLELTNKLIYKNALETFETKLKSLFLGGDHSISYSLVMAFLNYCRNESKEPCLVVFDSMPNCVHTQNKLPSNKQWLKKLIENGFTPANVMLVGVRNYSKEEIIFLKEKKIKIMDVNKIFLDIENICDTIMEFSNGKELYLSLDLSVVDPVYAPSTNNNRPGGLNIRQLIYFVQRLNKVKGLRAIDIVEINAEQDKLKNNITVKLGAKILGEFL